VPGLNRGMPRRFYHRLHGERNRSPVVIIVRRLSSVRCYNWPMPTLQVSGQAFGGPYRRILAVKLADLGDLLTITPALQALRAAYPEARIDLLAPPQSAHILEGAPYVDNILRFDKFALDNPLGLLRPDRLLGTVSYLLKLRLARYDAFAIFHHATTRWGVWQRALLAL